MVTPSDPHAPHRGDLPERTAAPADRWFVHYYDPKKRGTWIAKFEKREDADRFAVGKRVWGEPSVVKPIEELRQ